MSDEKKNMVDVCGVEYQIPEENSNIQHSTLNVEHPMNEKTAEFVDRLRRQMKDLEFKYHDDSDNVISYGRMIEFMDIFFVQQNVEACLLKIVELTDKIHKLEMLEEVSKKVFANIRNAVESRKLGLAGEGIDAILIKYVGDIEIENQKLKEEVEICEKLSADLVVTKVWLEGAEKECGKSWNKKQDEYEQQISDLKDLVSSWQNVFHHRGQRLHKQRAQIQALKAKVAELERFTTPCGGLRKAPAETQRKER